MTDGIGDVVDAAKPDFVIEEAPPAKPRQQGCTKAEDCNDFCKGAGADKECLQDGIAHCVNNRCGCALTCR